MEEDNLFLSRYPKIKTKSVNNFVDNEAKNSAS